jgi:hypothetical protein
MRWFGRVAFCLLLVVLAPTPAHAWFAWLDHLSGPGRWYGAKVDVRFWCFGRTMPFEEVAKQVATIAAKTPTLRTPSDALAAEKDWNEVLQRLQGMDRGLGVVDVELAEGRAQVTRAFGSIRSQGRLAERISAVELQKLVDELAGVAKKVDNARIKLHTATVSIAFTGIFINLCSIEKRKSFAIEAGFTQMVTPGNSAYANKEKIWLTTYTAGLSYRIPLPADWDVADLGTNVGMYHFQSNGFREFSGWTLEPFVDLHFPTWFVVHGNKVERFFARFSVRGGLMFFPGGFKTEQFGPPPLSRDISGKDVSKSLTVFFRVIP